MYGHQSKEQYARSNKEDRLGLYLKASVIAAIFTIGPVGIFFCDFIIKPPKPISAEFAGIEGDGVPRGDYHEVYHYGWASPEDEMMNVLGFFFMIIAGATFAALMYCIARFLADPIMYRIDLHYDIGSPVADRLKCVVICIVGLLYCGVVAYAVVYETVLEDEDVWLEDGQGVYYRVDKDVYEKYMNNRNNIKEENMDQPPTETTTETVPITTEDRSKTPVERGYPSNDIEYYLDHPDEPIPQDLVDDLLAPDDYNPGLNYNPEMDYNGY